MTAKLILLGTAAAFPTKERAHSALLLDIGEESLLFDCGENAQRQIALAKASPMKISKIFISHWHGDHVLGLGGLLQSFQMNRRMKKIDIYGPEKTRERFRNMLAAFELRVGYPVDVYEIKASLRAYKIIDAKNYEILVTKCKHPIPCLAFAYQEKTKRRIDIDYLKKFGLTNNPIIKRLQEGKDIMWKGKKIKAKDATYLQPGKKLTFIVDSAYAKNLVGFAKNSDLLVCEATFASELAKEAKEFGHMSAVDAAMLAKKAKVKKLILTHFSQRYKDINVLLQEARKIFPNTIAAEDLMEISI
ncbi:MAG: ribonuclease Z [Candidatus Nanoarchaeia archaeon]